MVTSRRYISIEIFYSANKLKMAFGTVSIDHGDLLHVETWIALFACINGARIRLILDYSQKWCYFCVILDWCLTILIGILFFGYYRRH